MLINRNNDSDSDFDFDDRDNLVNNGNTLEIVKPGINNNNNNQIFRMYLVFRHMSMQ
jgi:hypothetical protein